MFCACTTDANRSTLLQFYYGLNALLSLVGSGLVMGYSAVALPLLTRNGTHEFSMLNGNDIASNWFASITSVAIPLGCIISVFTMKTGRRIALMSSGIVFIIGWIIIATSYGILQLLIGRFITGLGIGLAATPAPVYVSEIATLKNKTTLTACTNIASTGGVMLIYILGYIIPNNWRLIAASTMIIPIISTIVILFLTPESPQWLLNRGKLSEARRELLYLRGLTLETPRFQEEFHQMVIYHAQKLHYINTEENNQDTHVPVSSSISHLENFGNFFCVIKRPEVWKPFGILNIYFFFQQFCGIYVIIAYAVNIVIHIGIVADAYFITVMIGLVQFIGGVALVMCSPRIGRRTLSIVSGVGMAASLGIIAIYVQLEEKAKFNGNYSAIPIIAIFIFVFTGSFGFESLPWAMIGELYPTKYINVMGPITCCISGIFNFVSLQIYPVLTQYDFCVAIYFYCTICIVGTIFVITLLPETHGRSKNEIEMSFRNE